MWQGGVAKRGGSEVAKYDVVVVGAGNAAFCAAQAAAEKGSKVLMVERAPKELMGGNSRFTAGAFRCVYDGVDDLKAIMPDLTKDEIDRSDFGTYTQDQFYDDMFRVTQYRTDGELCDRLVGRSRDAMRWLHGKGMKFDPIWGRQAYLIDGKFKFWGGLTVESKGGGPGLIDQHLKLAEKNGIEVRYNTRGISLIYDGTAAERGRLQPSRRCRRPRARRLAGPQGRFAGIGRGRPGPGRRRPRCLLPRRVEDRRRRALRRGLLPGGCAGGRRPEERPRHRPARRTSHEVERPAPATIAAARRLAPRRPGDPHFREPGHARDRRPARLRRAARRRHPLAHRRSEQARLSRSRGRLGGRDHREQKRWDKVPAASGNRPPTPIHQPTPSGTRGRTPTSWRRRRTAGGSPSSTRRPRAGTS